MRAAERGERGGKEECAATREQRMAWWSVPQKFVSELIGWFRHDVFLWKGILLSSSAGRHGRGRHGRARGMVGGRAAWAGARHGLSRVRWALGLIAESAKEGWGQGGMGGGARAMAFGSNSCTSGSVSFDLGL